jgi:hypothetical protein
LLPLERELLDRDDPFLLELEERDRDELARDRVDVERELPDFDRDDDLRVVDRLPLEPLLVERRVVVDPPELLLLFPTGVSGAGAGVVRGALAAAVRARALATATSGSTPSSRSAMIAPTAIATAAASPRKMPILRSPGLAKKRHRMINTLSVPSAAVTPPRGTGMFTR